MRLVALAMLAVTPLAAAIGQTPFPPAVQDGLDALAKGKCQAAIDVWSQTWPELQKAQMAGACASLQQIGGELHGYDLLHSVNVTPHITRVYIVLLYTAQPVYLMLVAYQPGGGDWKVGAINWNTDPDKVVPAAILPPQRSGP